MGGGQQGCQQHLGAAGAEQHARWFEQHPPCAAAWHAAACPRWLHPLLLFVFFLPARRLGDLNPASLEVVPGAVASPELAKANPGDRCASRFRAACPHPHPSTAPASQGLPCLSSLERYPSLGTSGMFPLGKPGCYRSLSLSLRSSLCSTAPTLPHLLPPPPSTPAPRRFQLERLGYFCVDPDESAGGGLVLNRTCTLRESFPKQAAPKGGK